MPPFNERWTGFHYDRLGARKTFKLRPLSTGERVTLSRSGDGIVSVEVLSSDKLKIRLKQSVVVLDDGLHELPKRIEWRTK